MVVSNGDRGEGELYEMVVEELVEALRLGGSGARGCRCALAAFRSYLQSEGLAVEDVDADRLERYREYLSSRYSRATARAYLSTAYRFVSFCRYKAGVAFFAPKPRRIGASGPTMSTELLSIGEIRAVLSAADKGAVDELGKRARAIAYMMLYGAMRPAELVQADMSDLLIEPGGVFIRTRGWGDAGKGKVVALADPAAAAVVDYINATGGRERGGALLVSRANRNKGLRISERSVHADVSKLLDEAGVSKNGVTPYSLRLSALVLLIADGATIAEAQNFARLRSMQSILRISDHWDEIQALANVPAAKRGSLRPQWW